MSGRVKIATVVAAAARLGVITNTPQGRAGVIASIERDPVMGSVLVEAMVARATASRRPPTHQTQYPASWLPRARGAVRNAASRRAATPQPSTQYPASWRSSVTAASRRSGRVVEVLD